MTVFVGPNNAGKSLVLKEILAAFSSPDTTPQGLKIVSGLRVADVGSGEVLEELLRGGAVHETEAAYVFVGPVSNSSLNKGQWGGHYGADNAPANLHRAYAVSLDGATRLQLARAQKLAHLRAAPGNYLDVLFRDDELRASFRNAVFEAIGRYPVLDATDPGHVEVRLAERPPVDPSEERALDEKALAFHEGSALLREASDGLKAFVSLVGFVLAGRHRVIAIDEPDGFLHPPLSRKLGMSLASLAQGRGGQVFAATHSSAFLLGCVTSGVNTQVVRLTYENGRGYARRLPPENVAALARDGLMRSTNALDAIFHEAAIVTESANDSVFYDEVNGRLARAGEGLSSCAFLNAQNKQTVHRVLQPLRALGVPAAAIVDLDILKPDGTAWTQLLRAAAMPEVWIQSTSSLKAKVWKDLQGTSKDPKRDGGVALLAGDARRAADELLELLSSYGIFVVPGGELQSWLRELGATGHTMKWLDEVLDRMGSDPRDASYVKPSIGDVWDFIRQIARWSREPARKGMPD